MSLCDAYLFCFLSGEGSGVGVTQGPVKSLRPLSAQPVDGLQLMVTHLHVVTMV